MILDDFDRGYALKIVVGIKALTFYIDDAGVIIV